MSDPTITGAEASTDGPRRCWICLGDETDSTGSWSQPCPCSLVCHTQCLMRWVTESQREDPQMQIRCPQCNTPYKMDRQHSHIVRFINRLEPLATKAALTIAASGLTSCAFTCMTTYGAYAVLTLCGSLEGTRLLGSPTPWGWRIWVGLPLIPMILVGSRTPIFDNVLPLLPLIFVQPHDLSPTFPPNSATIVTALPWVRVDIETAVNITTNTDDGHVYRQVLNTSLADQIDFMQRRDSMGQDVLAIDQIDQIHRGPGDTVVELQTGIQLKGTAFVRAVDIVSVLYKYRAVQSRKRRRILNYGE
ncbi:hypothetical protein BJ085DRAFT_40921 [Dimargaris cristalligena]|uniref:RING-CH-type domain-containing protein n=1 Tax=Dimargaris cristalligena TaxID=215637 RepID=A0A4P9ZQI9_9FUNG|nr:hypothetical protein BJ085DRAFT_40921 [Dimargaris cristalligena]|eukprot:RKP35001.1 hypothetical protein BJ085DRAFT_40921 [Dimargaris cristalligena]